MPLPDYWIGATEVTNREFKRFVDAGGYRDARYWKEPFRDGERVAGVRRSDRAFPRHDRAKRAGHLGAWQLSRRAGETSRSAAISWFEAAAYAEYAGASLPSIYHWFRAVGRRRDLLATSCGSATSTARGPCAPASCAASVRGARSTWPATSRSGAPISRSGTSRRYILGGGWNEPGYRFTDADAQDPWQRQPTFGVRLVKNLGPADAAAVPVGRVNGDPKSVVPASDAALRRVPALLRVRPHSARTRASRRSTTACPEWRKETVSFDAAYGGERVPAYLFLPKNATPPYQTVVFFPSGYAAATPIEPIPGLLRAFDFIVRSGRALLYPVYQGTFERRQWRAARAEREARHGGAVGEGLLPRGRLPGHPQGHRHRPARRTTA